MSNPRPTCQFFAPHLQSGHHRHQLDCQPFKKPRVSEAVSIRTMPMAKNEMLPFSDSYKTRVCHNFEMGRCDYGQRCRFAHGIGDIRRVWPYSTGGGDRRVSNQVCRLFYNGKCTFGDQCRHVHPLHESAREKSVISVSSTGAKGYHHIGGSDQSECRRPVGLRKLCDFGKTKSGTMQNLRTSSSGTAYYTQVEGTGCNLKWNDLEKMSRIYADWIEDLPISSRKVDC